MRERCERHYRDTFGSATETPVFKTARFWSCITVYFDGRSDANAAGAVVSVYGFVEGVRALLASFTATLATRGYAWTIPTDGASAFEVAIATPLGRTTSEVAVGAVAFGEEPSGGATSTVIQAVANVAATVADTTDIVFVTGLSAPRVLTLPTATAGRILEVKCNATCTAVNTITVTPVGGALVDGLAAWTLATSYAHVRLACLDGTNWSVL